MAAPTFVAEYEASFSAATTPKDVAATEAVGDVFVVVGGSETNASINTPTGGGLVFALQQSILVTNFCSAYGYTAVAASAQAFTLSVPRGAVSGDWGFNTFRFSGSDGVGNSAKANVNGAAPTLNITTAQANSALVVIVLDWNAGDGATRTWRTVNGITPTAVSGEQTYYFDSLRYTVYAAYYSDAGAAGIKTVGLSAPAGQKYSIIAIEVRGTGSAAPGTVTLTPATATRTAVAVTPTPGPVTTTLTPATATRTAVAVTATPGPVTVALTPASATRTAVPVTPVPGAVTVALTPASATLSAVATGPAGVGAGGAVGLTPASTAWTALPVTPVPGPVTVALTPVSATRAAVAVTPTPGLVTIPLTPAMIISTAQAVVAEPVAVAEVVLTPVVASLSANPVVPVGAKMPLNTYELPLAKLLLACLDEALSTDHPNPPARTGLRVGEVAFDLSETEDLCCDGLAYVKINNVYPSNIFPAPDETYSPCGSSRWAVDLEMGILRCAPVGSLEYVPTEDDWEAAAEQVAHDSAAMRVAVATFRDRMELGAEWLPRLWLPIGPAGACTGGTQVITVGFIQSLC